MGLHQGKGNVPKPLNPAKPPKPLHRLNLLNPLSPIDPLNPKPPNSKGADSGAVYGFGFRVQDLPPSNNHISHASVGRRVHGRSEGSGLSSIGILGAVSLGEEGVGLCSRR